ncbi:MAG: hypothetical protein KGJ13_06075 [Patescibacteria group bacterium]|nr:hypothetical protein [Patescibacteria group bacterium]
MTPLGRIVCHFSCGAASAVTCKLILAEYSPSRVVIFNAFLEEEHADNRRFLKDCENWLDFPITQLADERYGASAREVWRKKRFLVNGVWGAPCSMELKRRVIEEHCQPTDQHAMGFTVEERHRASRYTGILTPLIDRNLTHDDCLEMIRRAGLELPAMYRLGYNNANCIGCPKGGEGYWNKIRKDFPDRFQEVMAIQEEIGPGAYFFRNRETGERYGLKSLPADRGRHIEPLPSCSFFCAMAEDEIKARE